MTNFDFNHEMNKGDSMVPLVETGGKKFFDSQRKSPRAGEILKMMTTMMTNLLETIGPCRIRTCDSLLKRQILYLLS